MIGKGLGGFQGINLQLTLQVLHDIRYRISNAYCVNTFFHYFISFPLRNRPVLPVYLFRIPNPVVRNPVNTSLYRSESKKWNCTRRGISVTSTSINSCFLSTLTPSNSRACLIPVRSSLVNLPRASRRHNGRVISAYSLSWRFCSCLAKSAFIRAKVSIIIRYVSRSFFLSSNTHSNDFKDAIIFNIFLKKPAPYLNRCGADFWVNFSFLCI